MSRGLATKYCGLELRSPVVVGACPITLSSERVRQFTFSGAGAIVLPSLFEEQILNRMESCGLVPTSSEQKLDVTAPLEDENYYNRGVDEYLRTIARLKRQVGIPIFASLHGCTSGTWLTIGQEIQAAGADGIEANFDSPIACSHESADDAEQLLLEMVTELCDQVTIPVAVKISPFHSNISNLMWRLSESGAAGVVCFGFEPNWKVGSHGFGPTPHWNLNATGNLNQTIAGLARASVASCPLSMAASGGISTAEDAIKVLLAGADVTMITSEIYRSGTDAIAHIIEGLTQFLKRGHYEELNEFLLGRPKPNLSRQTLLACITQSRR